jgi:hypothetical protein
VSEHRIRAVVVDLGACAPIEDVVAMTSGALGGSSALQTAGVAAEEAIDLRADLTGLHCIGVVASDLGSWSRHAHCGHRR